MNQVYLFYMNDLQKKLAIVGSTAFIVWFLMAFENGAFAVDNFYGFIIRAIYFNASDSWYTFTFFATWINALTFAIWVGSLIAYNIYKEDK